MRIINPIYRGKPGVRRYSPVRRIDQPYTGRRRPSSRVYGGGGGWWGTGCGFWGCNAWPWYVGVVPVAAPLTYDAQSPVCTSPIEGGVLVIDGRWAVECFWPAYAEARLQWGGNASSLAQEILLQIDPGASIESVGRGAEDELRRRVELAVAVLLNDDGIPTKYPRRAVTPRPSRADQIRVPWIRALVTGWV